jgi:hypothetical protein
MRRLSTRNRAKILILLLAAAVSLAWLYWNRPTRADLSAYAPADCLAFVEANDLAELASGIGETQAWKSLAGPIGAPQSLLPNRWLLRVAKWTGIGSPDTILLARSQVAVVLSGAQGTQADSTLTIKPLATLIIETHTSQRRMRALVEHHIEDLARRVYKNPAVLRKQISGIDLEEWTPADSSHRIVVAFVDTALIIGNDETSVLHSIEARNGSRPSLKGSKELDEVRHSFAASNASLFGFVSQTGVKSLLQAFALYRGGSSADAVTAARIFADVFGGLVQNVGWSSRFADGMIEDRCSITLVAGAAEKLRGSMVPERGVDLTEVSFAPPEANSFSLYQFHDTTSFWNDLNAVVSSHTDLVGSIAARPMLRGLLKPYGIDDPDTFARAIGPRLRTIRLEENFPSVLVVEAFDRPALLNSLTKRFGQNPKREKVGDAELLLSASDNLAAAVVENYLLIGPGEGVRRCLLARAQSQSIASNEGLREAEKLVDVSLPLSAISFANDQHAAISFVESFSYQQRSAFATNAPAIDQAVRVLPYAVSVSMLKGSGIEWTSRSSFGVAASLVAQFVPANSR